MSEAPERIWAFVPDIFDNMSVWQDQPSPALDTTEYIRADRIEALEARARDAEAERDALREALREIATGPDHLHDANVARAALNREADT